MFTWYCVQKYACRCGGSHIFKTIYRSVQFCSNRTILLLCWFSSSSIMSLTERIRNVFNIVSHSETMPTKSKSVLHVPREVAKRSIKSVLHVPREVAKRSIKSVLHVPREVAKRSIKSIQRNNQDKTTQERRRHDVICPPKKKRKQQKPNPQHTWTLG